jgi:protocatechuate 3,4-dioxygenase beta subunit
MRPRRRVGILLAAAAVAAGLLVVLRSTESPTSDEAAQDESWPAAPQALDAAGRLAARPDGSSGSVADDERSSAAADAAARDPAMTIEGRVLDVDGRPVVRASVDAWDFDPRVHGGPFRPEWIAVTDDAGAFRFERVRPALLRSHCVWIEVEKRKGVRSPIVTAVPGARDVELRLAPTASARVHVVTEDGAPVPLASVKATLRQEDRKSYGLRVTDVIDVAEDDGVATLVGLDVFGDKRPTLLVLPPTKRQRELLSATLASWDLHDVTVRLEKSYMIAGVVRDLAGRPVPRATVWLHDAAAPGAGPVDESADAQGRFRLTDLRRESDVRIWAQVHGTPFAGVG